jgi:hypothetical protein
MTLAQVVSAILPSLVVGVFMAFFNRAQKRRDEETESRAAARQKESLLALELNMSTAKLSYATAVALRRGHANGEVEEGMRAYNEAKKKYVDFLNEQANEHLAG